MNIYDFKNNPQKTLFAIAVIGLFLTSISQGISSFVWVSRSYPYFSKFTDFEYVSCVVNHQFSGSFLFSFVNAAYIIVIVMLGISSPKGCLRSKFDKTNGILCLFSIELLLSFIEVLYGFLASLHAIAKGDTMQNPCFSYIKQSFDEMDAKFDDSENYQQWKEKILSKIFDDDGHLTSYLCDSVGTPVLIFTIFHSIFLILLFAAIIVAWKNQSETIERANPDIGKKLLNDSSSGETRNANIIPDNRTTLQTTIVTKTTEQIVQYNMINN